MLHTLIHRGRTSPFDALREQFDQLFERDAESYGLYGAYPVDIREDDNHVYVDAEMPGFTAAQVNVTLEDGVLTIEAQRDEKEQTDGTTHLRQRRYSRINRRFTLPNTVDEDKVGAKLEHGVLHLTLTKREEVRPRKIEVK